MFVCGAMAAFIDPPALSMDVLVMIAIFIAGLNVEEAYKGATRDGKLGAILVNQKGMKEDMLSLKEQINIDLEIANRACKKRQYPRIR
jgi:hypothetical protein